MPAIPLQNQLHAITLTDKEIRRIVRDAAKEADSIMASLAGKEGVGSKVRSAQIALAKTNAEMWAAVGDATKVGIGDAFDLAAEHQAVFDDALFKAAGINGSYWRMSQLATARAGIPAFIARQENGITLSQRVWRNQALSKGYLDKAINNGLLLGKSAREIAKSVVGFINPNVPGGASYAAMRLGRTEVANAFHTRSVKGYQQTPWINKVKWSLSGSHPAGLVDDCNDYAEGVHFRGGEPGEFLPMEVPGKPHPQCLCYVEPVVMDLDQYVKNYKAGHYDNYINKQLGCSVA